jgi:glycerol-3-phosphate acyltransferase PlsX
MRIALDAMGGDYAPGPIVQGAVEAVEGGDGIEVTLVGDRAQVETALAACGGPTRGVEFFHCTQTIGMDESPVEALRRKRDSSIIRCWELLAKGRAEAIVSAGSTGAMVAAGLFQKRFLPGVKRPGIAVVLPTAKGPCVLLDVGANMAAKPEHLFQYGVMGSIYARHILKIDTPTVALMNVGTEESKGTELAKETHSLFDASHLKDHFVGNIEGRDIYRGTAHVIVCDGFVGNVVLKVCEGLVEMILNTSAEELLGRLPGDHHDIARAAFNALMQRYDYSEYGGAPLLGIDGICIICHGASGAPAIRNAIKVAATFAHDHINAQIVAELGQDAKQSARRVLRDENNLTARH